MLEALRMGSCRGSCATLAVQFPQLLFFSFFFFLTLSSLNKKPQISSVSLKEEDKVFQPIFLPFLVLFVHDVPQKSFESFYLQQWIQYSVSCCQWLAPSHLPSLCFKVIHSTVVKEVPLFSQTTPIFPVILTLLDCPIHMSYRLLMNLAHQ